MEFGARILLFLAIIKAGQADFEITEILDPDVDKKVHLTSWKPGDDNLELTCTMKGDFVGAIHTVKWAKAQPRKLKDGKWEIEARLLKEYPLSSAGQIDIGTVFSDEGRFRIEYSQNDGEKTYVYTLVIERPEPEDSGRYRCYGNDGENVHNLIYWVNVHVPVDSVELTGRLDSEVEVNDTTEDMGPLVYYTNRPGSLSCSSIGGFPVPLLNFYANDENGERVDTLRGFDMIFKEEDQLVGDKLGLQRYNFQVTETNDNFRGKVNYDGGTIQCEAKVSSTVEMVERKTDTRAVEIMAPPDIVAEECPPVQWAEVGETNVVIRCRYSTRMAAKTVHWEVGNTGQVLEETDRDGPYSTSVKVVSGESDLYDAKLMIDEVTSQSFQVYNVMVENHVDWSIKQKIELRQGEAPEDPGEVCDPEDESCGAQRTASLFTGVIYSVAIATSALVMLRL